MTTSVGIVDAARRLSEARLHSRIEEIMQENGRSSHHVSRALWPSVSDILLLAAAGKQIAVLFKEMPEVVYKDYNPVLEPALCGRFSILLQYDDAPKGVQEVVARLGYRDVIGIYLAGESQESVLTTLGINPRKKSEFLGWVDAVLPEVGISFDDPRIADFRHYAALVKIMHCTPARDQFPHLLTESVCLGKEGLLESDCQRLLKLGIQKTPDLAQTSIQVLAREFADDIEALDRLSVFLATRNLRFGMKFPPTLM